MKSYDIVGYTKDGEFQCVDCCAGINLTGADPTFGGSEWDYYPTCCVCHEKCTDVGLTDDGREHEMV